MGGFENLGVKPLSAQPNLSLFPLEWVKNLQFDRGNYLFVKKA
jgi:hypothetical protein